MSTSLVIVAIPEEQDRVWQVSSEQVPHLTLLYLGNDVTQVQHVDQIEQFVEHAVTLSEHGPFYLDVKRRGVLGPNEADVLFFNERSWNLKWIKQFRGQLLQNDAVRTAFDSAAQFGAVQEWLPHLTLGSPDAPAQPIPKDGFDHPFYSVCFDRIAVWTQEYAGPEFLLEWPDREFDGDLAVAYSDTKKAELIHYAMNGGKTTTEDKKAEAVGDTLGNGAAFVSRLVHASVLDNASVAAQIKAKIQSILDDVTGDGDGDIKLFGDPLVRTKIQSVLQDFYQDPNVDNAIVYDALGEKFLEHFGIKGMRWGVRKADPIKSQSGHTIIRGKAKVNVEGGGGHSAHPDAVKVAEAKTKLKKSGAAALSNEELRTVANRLQLEGQVHQLIKSKGKVFVDRHLQEQGNQLVRTGIREGAKRGIKRAARVAGTAAVVAA